jgi:5-methylcytosine-specific restriction endonuclease McrA
VPVTPPFSTLTGGNVPTKEFYWKNRERLLKQEADRYKRERTRILSRNKRWNAAHPEAIDRNAKKWDAAHPERRLEIGRAYFKRNKKLVNARCRVWAKENPESNKVRGNKRRTAKTKAGGSFTAAEWKALCKKYHNKCLCCGKRRKLTADHVIPVSKGGSSNISNIQPLCGPCNSSKRDKTIDYRRGAPCRVELAN